MHEVTHFNIVENSGHYILMKIIFGRKMEFSSLYITVSFIDLIKHPFLAKTLMLMHALT